MSTSIALDYREGLPRGGAMAWLVCLSAGLFFFYEFFQLNIFDVINQPLRDDFGLDAEQLSWMSSTYLWADLLFLLPAGIILDRFSTKKVILIAMFTCIVGTLGFALTTSYPLACFYHFLSGIGNAFCFLSCVVLVANWFPLRKQAMVIGTLVTMAFLGGMMAHTPFASLNDYLGWRNALLLDGTVGILLFLWIALFVQDLPENNLKRSARTDNQAVLQGIAQAVKNKQTWLAGFYTCFLNLPIMVLCALWGATYLQVVHQLTELAASNVVSLIYFGSIIGCPLVGWLSDRQGKRKPIMILGAAATILSLLPLFLGLPLTENALSVIFFALGFFSSTQVISYPMIAESNPSHQTGSATGLASLLIMGGAGVGQVLFGTLMQYHAGVVSKHYSVADFQYAMWMFPMTILLALFAMMLMKETHCKRN